MSTGRIDGAMPKNIDTDDEKKVELAQVLRELDQLEREMCTRMNLLRRRLKSVLGESRTAGPKVFELYWPDGRVRKITMRGLGKE